MRVQMHSSAYRDRNRKLKQGSAWPLRRQPSDLRCATPTAYGARDRNRTGMPGLAAAGFKPAVYTNFTTLANRRMILEDCVMLEARNGSVTAGSGCRCCASAVRSFVWMKIYPHHQPWYCAGGISVASYWRNECSQ